MKIEQINELQKQFEVFELQESIDSGAIWKMTGSSGRLAMQCLQTGECFLPLESYMDYWGNRVPSRNDLAEGTQGTLENAQNYWIDRMINMENQIMQYVDRYSPLEIASFLSDYTKDQVFFMIDRMQSEQKVYFDTENDKLSTWSR